MQPEIATSPVSLSYVAALRGVKPRLPGEAFTYAEVNCREHDLLICLAASNPEGQFFALIEDRNACAAAAEQASLRDVTNVTFIYGSITNLLGQLDQASVSMPALNYLSCDDSDGSLKALDREALYVLAEKKLMPGGLLNYTYRAYEGDDGALRFLVREFAPEMNATQAKEFLQELKSLGARYFLTHKDLSAKLDAAITRNIPDEFFDLFDQGTAKSATFDTIVALRPRSLIYVGDSDISANYIELMVPPEAQETIVKCRTSPLYEPIKDFTLNRPIRTDIWCRQPVQQVTDIAELFGSFTFGIHAPRENVPSAVKVQGKTVDLSSQLFTNLINLLTLLPATVGDFLGHATSKGTPPLEVVGAIQILVACGIAQPMRGGVQAGNLSNISQPRLVGGFNQYLDKTALTGTEVWMASPVVGSAIRISARDALVMQALGRAGLANSVAALLPELQRLAENPAQASKVMDITEPTAEMAQAMVQDVVGKSIVQWYAYGLLEAA